MSIDWRIPSGLAIAMSLAIAGCGPGSKSPAVVAKSKPLSVEAAGAQREVDRFCGDCHATPLPNSFPRDRWIHEVDRGFQFYLLSGRSDLALPARAGILSYYQSRAPERLELPATAPPEDTPRFQRWEQTWQGEGKGLPAIAHLLSLPSGDKNNHRFATCDMRSGVVEWIDMQQEARREFSTKLNNPDHICATDLDKDGVTDYVVADLGSFLPEDHDQGRVVWLKPDKSPDQFEQIVLLDGIGRVADVQPADVDGDGRLDLLVAVFGWQSTGELLLLRRTGSDQEVQFAREKLDSRHGAIHVCVANLNGDDAPDLVVLFSQEHEVIVGFMNRGDGSFDRETIYRAPDPSYGSSGIDVVDLDRDGDLDVLYTNGDTFDSFYVKPYHGVRWIENRNGEWREHLLTALPGVHRALAGDLDGDGDLDVAACVLIPATALARQPDATSLASLIWLENQDLTFVPHAIELDNCVHAVLQLTDVDGDDKLDIVAGNFQSPPSLQTLPPLTVWLNRPMNARAETR